MGATTFGKDSVAHIRLGIAPCAITNLGRDCLHPPRVFSHVYSALLGLVLPRPSYKTLDARNYGKDLRYRCPSSIALYRVRSSGVEPAGANVNLPSACHR